MVGRKIIIKKSAADSIAEVAWFIESMGLLRTANKFNDGVYDFISKLGDIRKSYPNCREPIRAALGYKSVKYKKYTIVFIENENEIIICEFISSKLIYW